MGNTASAPPKKSSRRERRSKRNDTESESESAAVKAQQMIKDAHRSLKDGLQNFEPDTSMFDNLCGQVFDNDDRNNQRSYSMDSEEDSRFVSGDDSTYNKSVLSQSDYESGTDTNISTRTSFTEDDSYISNHRRRPISESKPHSGLSKPLASSFAKRCYFTKAGIGKSTQHYEGLTLTGNVVLMLAAAMKLKGCPTICDEDLRRVEQTYPNQFSRLPDELLLSSGWRRISKYCHFSNKPIPDGVPFFHSKKRLHPSGGFYFLLAAAVGMIRPLDVEPLTRDTLVLLETDYPNQCDAAPSQLTEDANEWTLVEKFCFFSGGPINTEEDVYYMADFEGNPIYMLAFLSPSLTPEELYKLSNESDDIGLKTIAAVEDVESVYDLTERDFDDLKLYHLGPCRALPQYILQPKAWVKVLPPHFLAAKNRAMDLAQEWEMRSREAMQYDMASEQMLHKVETRHIPTPEKAHVEPPHVEPPQFEPQQFEPPQFEPPQFEPPQFEPPQIEPPQVDPPQVDPPQVYSPSHETSVTPSSLSSLPSQSFSNTTSQLTSSQLEEYSESQTTSQAQQKSKISPSSPPKKKPPSTESFQREIEEEGAFIDPSIPMDEAISTRKISRASPGRGERNKVLPPDPPVDEPPSLSRIETQNSEAELDIPDPDSGDFTEMQMESSPEKNNSREEEYYDSPERRKTNSTRNSSKAKNFYSTPSPKGSQRYQSNDQVSEPEFISRQNTPQTQSSTPQEQNEERTRMPQEHPSASLEDESNADVNNQFSLDQEPVSPNGNALSPSSEYSRQSHTMRSAQELLRKRQQKQNESQENTPKNSGNHTVPTPRGRNGEAARSPRSPPTPEITTSNSSWEDSVTTGMSGASSTWTDNSNALVKDRSSRRALILQMAKARMKQNKNAASVGDRKTESTITEEEPSFEASFEANSDLDLTAELD